MFTVKLVARTRSQWRGLNVYPSGVSHEAEVTVSLVRKFPQRMNRRRTYCPMAVFCPSLGCLPTNLPWLKLTAKLRWICLHGCTSARCVVEASQRRSDLFCMNGCILENVLMNVKLADVGSRSPATSGGTCRCTVVTNHSCASYVVGRSSAVRTSRITSPYMLLHTRMHAASVQSGSTPVDSCGCTSATCTTGRPVPQPTASGIHVRYATRTSRQRETSGLTCARIQEKDRLSVLVERLMRSASSWCSTRVCIPTSGHSAAKLAADLSGSAVLTLYTTEHIQVNVLMFVNIAESHTRTRPGFGRMQHGCIVRRMTVCRSASQC